jgi:hypothetical protein
MVHFDGLGCGINANVGEHLDIVLENVALVNVHMFMHQISKPLDATHARDLCVDPDIVKPESFFIDNNVTTSKVVSWIKS